MRFFMTTFNLSLSNTNNQSGIPTQIKKVLNSKDFDTIGKTLSWGRKVYLSYSEEDRSFDIKVLSIVQRFLRWFFGRHQNTHLKNVYTSLVTLQQTPELRNNQKFKNLIEKMKSCWKKKFPLLNHSNPIVYDQDKLKGVWEETLDAAKKGYQLNGKLILLTGFNRLSMQGETDVGVPLELMDKNRLFKQDVTVQVVNKDCIDHAIDLKTQGFNVALLNMANPDTPGGGVKNGATAQEEDICRRSDYMLALDPDENVFFKEKLKNNPYKIPENGVIYSPSVQFFREGQSKNFAFILPKTLSLIACAALNLGKCEKPSNYADVTKNKIRAILRCAVINHHDAIVLSAFGCGAFKNNPEEVSNFFKDVLQEEEFKGVFKHISFAITGKNFEVFNTVLNGLKIEKNNKK